MNPLAPLALFGAGLASFLTPCVLPLVPVYVGMLLAGIAEGDTRSALWATAVFVGSFTGVFVTLGVSAGVLGAALGDLQWWTVRAGGALVVILGLMLLVRLPGPLAGALHVARAVPGLGSRWRPVVLGIAFGAAWTPCAGPLLGAALITATTSEGAVPGAFLLAAYAAGVASPFIAASLITAWTGACPSAWTRRLAPAGRLVRPLAGALLLAIGAALADGLYV